VETLERRYRILAACALIGLLLAGCGGPPDATEADSIGTAAGENALVDRAFFEQASGTQTLEDAVAVLYRRCDEDTAITDKDACRDAVVHFFETEPIALIHQDQAGCNAEVESDHVALSGRDCVNNFHVVDSNNQPIDPARLAPDGRLAEGSGIARGSVPPPSESTDGGIGSSTTPEVEKGGPESAGPTETKPAVFTPKLPVGGSPQHNGEAAQCAQVSFLGQDENSIPPGVRIVVTAPVFTKSLFTVGGPGCEGEDDPPCLGGFVFTADHTGQCQVPVRTDVTRPSADDDTHDEFRLTGRLECAAGQEDRCRDLARRLDGDNQSIDLFPPILETPEPSGTTPTEPSDPGSTETTPSTSTPSTSTASSSAASSSTASDSTSE
jgi:hypothetical protein